MRELRKLQGGLDKKPFNGVVVLKNIPQNICIFSDFYHHILCVLCLFRQPHKSIRQYKKTDYNREINVSAHSDVEAFPP